MSQVDIKLKDFSFQALFTVSGLTELDTRFLSDLKQSDQQMYARLLAYRRGELQSAVLVSQLLIDCAPCVETFIAKLFFIEDEVARLQASTLTHDPIFAFKKYYVQREARRALKTRRDQIDFNKLNQWLNDQLKSNQLSSEDRELSVAKLGLRWLESEKHKATLIDWCVACLITPEGQSAVQDWVSFKLPKKLNYENLIAVEPVINDPVGRLQGPESSRVFRDGFQLTDLRMNARYAQNEIHYCVYCHKTDGDFCSKGFPVKKTDPNQGLKINPVGETLTGCPLEEKISEMHWLKKQGLSIAALAVVMIDNPMCPATGHRICNDCMKGCIYQKQEPVNIPQTESRILTDVLSLPWGVEIYDLLTRWNPLRNTQWLPKPYNGLKVLVMGMGPAGFTLAHHLLMEGFAVVGADGLKIEPLPADLINKPVQTYEAIKESLDNRIMAGFGGVAEYGITVRWDKNFLKLIYISLMRRKYFQVFGSVRFGGTLTIEDVWRLGFDHLSIAVGAGLPRELAIPNSLAPGMRQANDFLMALQLTGAAKPTSMANLQVRLPAVVIGGGLTGVDTATEVQAYYIAQVEKILYRYQKLIAYFGEDQVREKFNSVELQILDEFLMHGREVAQERAEAQQEKRKPRLNAMIRAWGGVTIVYRRTMQESPAYCRNHEELMSAFNEGIFYIEGLEPTVTLLDENGHVKGLACHSRVMDEVGNWMFTDEETILPARAIFVATGAKPNVAYAFEHKGSLERNGFAYRRYEMVGQQLAVTEETGHAKIINFGPFTSYDHEQHRVSFVGDTHPIFHGSVVKAIASAKCSYPKIVKSLQDKVEVKDEKEYQAFRQRMSQLFKAEVIAVKRHTQQIVELTVKAPLAAANFAPGQFYRLQNYESAAIEVAGTRLQTEAMALLGIVKPSAPDAISFISFENGASSRLLATFQPGDPISVMGPTGARSKMPKSEASQETYLFIGGVLAVAHLLSHGLALRQAGHRVLFVGVFNNKDEIFCQDEIEAAADAILWITPHSNRMAPRRSQDLASGKNLVEALKDYAMLADIGTIPLSEINRVIIIGSSQLLRTIQHARSGPLQPFFHQETKFIASVHGPMQCMLKGVCAQCLQWQIDPETGQRTKAVYACSWQNQPMEIIDIDNIDERLSQNRTQEILTNLWLDYLFAIDENTITS